MRTEKLAAVVLAAVVATVGTACGADSDEAGDPAVATVTSFVTAGSTPAQTSSSAPSSTGARGSAALRRGYDRLASSLPQATGIAIVPVGGGEVIRFGDQTPQVAWSTIKVPLAVAAERHGGQQAATRAAIVDSDNGSAESLWSSLGAPAAAAAAVTAVLREGGDVTTTVPSTKLRPEFTTFGQTSWPLASAATFTANLPCMRGGARVVGLMGQVAGNQQWGVEVIPARSTAVKGGWGPSVSGGYVVRQIGLVTRADGRQSAVAMSTYAPGASMDSGIAVLNRVGQWVSRSLASLPAGRCS